MTRPLAWVAAFLALCASAGCLMDGPRAGGSSSDGEAKIAGTARYADGRAAARVRVRLRDRDYLSDPSGATPQGGRDALTDSTGAFGFAGLPAGNYVLEANDENGSAALVTAAVNGTAHINLPTAFLKPTGAVKGVVDAGMRSGSAYVQAYGLEGSVAVDSASGVFLLPGLPEGDVRLVAHDPGRDTLRPDSAVTVKARDTVDVGVLEKPEDLSTWAASSHLALQASILGPLTGGLARVPVLVRLSAQDFPFADAQGHGEDIRFSQAWKPLRYEIAGWDSARGTAEIWVRLDTLPASGDPGLRVHWGKPGAVSRSKGYGVFMTSGGYYATWHLVRQSDSTKPSLAARVPDSSSNRNVGKAASTSPWALSADAGAPFGSLRLDAANPYVGTTKTYRPPEFTLSMWIRTGSRAGGRLMGLGDSRTDSSGLTDRVLMMDSSGRVAFGVAAGRDTGAAGTPRIVRGSKACNDGLWHHVAVVLSPDTGVTLYIDGQPDAVDPSARTAGTFLGWWRLGWDRMDAWPGYPQQPWQGWMREAWALHKAMPADWVRATYASGRPGLRLFVPAP